jgi:D-alanyl-D-alanine carboxypeptidase/D-alanyl-D-alanine-endopeptidase (penicillin-binding protein 4)
MLLRQSRTSIFALLALAGLPAAARPQGTPQTQSAELQGQLEAWFARASRSAPGTWGIAVASMDGHLIWGVQPTRPMIPASTVKLFTTGFARSVLGSNARRHTRVMGVGTVDPATGTWNGTWSLELNGDPTLERTSRGGPRLDDLAQQLYDQGIRRLVGPLNVISAAGPAGASYPDVWSPHHRGRLFAPLIGALTLNENVLSFAVAPAAKAGQRPIIVGESPAGVGQLVEIRAKTVNGRSSRLRYQIEPGGRYLVLGTIGIRARTRRFTSTAHDPRALLEAAWARSLRLAGIEWLSASGLSAPSAATTKTILAEVISEPFDTIASEVNRRSVNIGAELLLRWAAGDESPAEQLTAHVQQITGDYASIHLVDGSGLSHDDRASPLAFVSYLARFPLSPGGHGFPLLLPANGTGTLRKLARGLPGPGVVRAKTGTLGDAATLSGYLGRTDGVLLISLMYNGPRVWAARQQQWKLFRLLGADGVMIPEDSSAVGEQLGGENRERPKP